MSYYTYVLLQKSGTYYYGYTSDIDRRISQHQKGEVLTTKNKFKKVLYVKVFETKTEAIKYEKYLKSLKNPNAVDRLFSNTDENLVR